MKAKQEWKKTVWPYDSDHAKTCECYSRRLGRGTLYLHRSLGCKDGPSWSCVVSFGKNSDLSHTAGIPSNRWDSVESAQEYVDSVIVERLKIDMAKA